MEFYPTLPADASPVAGGMDARGVRPGIVAVRPADLRRPGRGGVSALPPGPAGLPVTSGEDLVFCHQVTVAPAVVRRSGDVQAGGWLPRHVTLGLLEAYLPGWGDRGAGGDFGCAEERQRLLPAAMTVRLLVAMTLMPDARVPEVTLRVAGLLACLPWARPWHVPGTEAVTRRLDMIPAELFEALFWLVAGPIAVRVRRGCGGGGCCYAPWTGSRSGSRTPRRTGSISARPAPRITRRRFPGPAVIFTAARAKATLGMEFGPSCDGEQTLTRRLARSRPGIFAAGRLILMDRNFPGFALIKAIRAQGAHLLMRMKSDIVLPLLKALPDGS